MDLLVPSFPVQQALSFESEAYDSNTVTKYFAAMFVRPKSARLLLFHTSLLQPYHLPAKAYDSDSTKEVH